MPNSKPQITASGNPRITGKNTNDTKGFGVIEMVIVSAIIVTALTGFLQAETLSLKLLRREKDNLEAILIAQEGLEAMRSFRDETWSNVSSLAYNTVYYPVVQNGKWIFTATPQPQINGRYTREVLIDRVFRSTTNDRIVISGSDSESDDDEEEEDEEDGIVPGATLDPDTVKAVSKVRWSGKQLKVATYLTNFVSRLRGLTEVKAIAYEGATTDGDLANFPSNNAGNGDPAQSFTTTATTTQISKVELFLKRVTASPSNVYVELRSTPTSAALATSSLVTSTTIPSAALTWIEFRFPSQVLVTPLTAYFIRLQSVPDSTVAFSGSTDLLHWGYRQTALSPYAGGVARRYVGRLSNPSDPGQLLDQYDFGFRVYALQ